MRGYLSHEVVKSVTFWTLSGCIAVATIAGILLSWEVIREATARRCFVSAVILAFGSGSFLLVNCVFGELGRSIFTGPVSPPIDPAFGDRLRRAKEGSAGENRTQAG